MRVWICVRTFSAFVHDAVRGALLSVCTDSVCVRSYRKSCPSLLHSSLRTSRGYARAAGCGVCVCSGVHTHSCPTCPHLGASQEILPLLLSPKSLLTASLPRAPEHWWLHEQNYHNTAKTWGNVTTYRALLYLEGAACKAKGHRFVLTNREFLRTLINLSY